MSKASVQQVIQKAVGDAAFRRQLQREPGKALAGLDLTTDERAAITSGDPARLTALGVDQRMSKAYALGATDGASRSIVGDAGTAGSAAFIDETASGATRGIVGDSTTGASGALTDTDGAQIDAGFVGDTTSGATSGIVGDATSGAAVWETDPLTGIPMQDDNSGLRDGPPAVWDTDPRTGIAMQDDNSGFRASDAFESDATSGSASLDGAIPGTSAAGIVDDGDLGGLTPTLDDGSALGGGDEALRPGE